MNSKKPVFESVCQIRPKSLVLFSQLLNPEDFGRSSTTFRHEKERLVYTGSMTAGAKKRLKKAIQTLVAISDYQTVIHPQISFPVKFRLNFITLTLPSEQGEISDSQITNQCLSKFLLECKRKDKLDHYIWKAERQKNMNIHYHITTNKFIHYSTVQDRWNNQMRAIGLLDKFKAKHGHDNPHSTEVKAVRNVTEIEKYLQKYYMKKEDEDKKIKGKVWDCSASLKSVPWPSWPMNNNDVDEMNKIVDQWKENKIEMDNCTVVWFDEKQRKQVFTPKMNIEFEAWKQRVRMYQRVSNILSTGSNIKETECT